MLEDSDRPRLGNRLQLNLGRLSWGGELGVAARLETFERDIMDYTELEIYVDEIKGKLKLVEALDYLTDKRISSGSYRECTIRNLRDCCLNLISIIEYKDPKQGPEQTSKCKFLTLNIGHMFKYRNHYWVRTSHTAATNISGGPYGACTFVLDDTEDPEHNPEVGFITYDAAKERLDTL